MRFELHRTSTIVASVSFLAAGVFAALAADSTIGAQRGLQTPSLILDSGTIRGQDWQTGARKDKGRPCFWARLIVRHVEDPLEWCGPPRGYPHFAILHGRGKKRVSVELIIAPLAARRVHLDLGGRPDRTVRLRRVGRLAKRVGLKRNFRSSSQTYRGRFCLVEATYFDGDGDVIREQGGLCESSTQGSLLRAAR